MRQELFSCALAGFLGVAPACVIVTDDEGSETVNDTGNDTGNGTTSSNATDDSSSSTAAASSGEVSTAADDTAADGACGWGPTGEKMVPEGYICGGDGADPDGNFPMLCPEGVELMTGGDCGSIEGPGCCDAEGNAWFCVDAGAGQMLSVMEC